MPRLGLSFLLLLFCSLLLPQLLFSQSSSLHGIDVTDLDRKADPCNDFFEYANGTWRSTHPIPASMMKWSKRWEAGESAKDRLKEILETAAADKNAPKGSTGQIIGDYYGACMDESRVNARGMDPFSRGSPASTPPKIWQISNASSPTCMTSA